MEKKRGLHGKIVLWLVVLVCGIIAVAGLSSDVRQEEEQVTITPEVLYGDPSVAEGMKVQIRTHYNYGPQWTTDFVVGQEDKAQTVVNHLSGQEPEEIIYLANLVLDTLFHVDPVVDKGDYKSYPTNTSIPWNNNNARIQLVKDYLGPVLEDVAAQCEPGDSTLQTVWLEKYFQYYPMAVNIVQLANGLGIWQDGEVYVPKDNYEWAKIMSDVMGQYFQIPVIHDDRVTIMMEKDDQGEVASLSLNAWTQDGGSSDPAGNVNCVSDQGIYFAMNLSPEQFDYSQVPGGYGLYFMPIVIEEDRICVVPEGLTTILSLPENQIISKLWCDETGDTVIIQRNNTGEGLVFDIVDVPSGKIIQTIGHGVTPEWDGNDKTRRTVHAILIRGDHLVIELLDDEYMVYQKKSDGIYDFCIAGNSTQAEEMIRQWKYDYLEVIEYDRMGMDFNGEYLALSWFMPYSKEDRMESCDIYVAVYGEEGLVYFGVYHNSLSVGGEGEVSSNRVNQMVIDPITLTWPE